MPRQQTEKKITRKDILKRIEAGETVIMEFDEFPKGIQGSGSETSATDLPAGTSDTGKLLKYRLWGGKILGNVKISLYGEVETKHNGVVIVSCLLLDDDDIRRKEKDPSKFCGITFEQDDAPYKAGDPVTVYAVPYKMDNRKGQHFVFKV